MKRFLLIFMVFGMVFAICTTAYSATTDAADSTLKVTATAIPSCKVSTIPVTFPEFEGAPIAGEGSVSVDCAAGIPFKIALDRGLHSGGDARWLKHQGTDNWLQYDLYKEPTHTWIWGDIGRDGSNYNLGSSYDPLDTTGDPVSYPVYGYMPAQPVVKTGKYSDTVKVWIYY